LINARIAVVFCLWFWGYVCVGIVEMVQNEVDVSMKGVRVDVPVKDGSAAV
jgi:hypothetical protein